MIEPMMATSNSESDSSRKNTDNKENDNQDERNTMFECNICLDNLNEPVVSVCGHLFCWPCLHRWLETTGTLPVCPVCKADIDKNKVIPIYGRNNFKQKDPRDNVPPRPSGHRTDWESDTVTDTDENVEFHLSLRLGPFPFDVSSLSDYQNRTQLNSVLHPDSAKYLSMLFIWVAAICLALLCLA